MALIDQFKPGLVHSQAYIDMVEALKEEGRALPAVNTISSGTVNAALQAAANVKSPIILQVSHGGAEFFAGKSFAMDDTMRKKAIGAQAFAQHATLMAEAYGVPVILNTDHADRDHIPWVENMIQTSRESVEAGGAPLFSSHMLDLSAEPLEDNIAESAKMLKKLNELGMSLEIELGPTGGEEDGVDNSDMDKSRLYTSPEEVWEAYSQLNGIGHLTVAAAFGNVHGVYKGDVELKPEILAEVQRFVRDHLRAEGENPLSFVFHGGSGSSVEDITTAIRAGVFKMNIDTDTQFAFANAIGQYVSGHPEAFASQIDRRGNPTKKQYDPRVWIAKGEAGVTERLEQAFADLDPNDVLGLHDGMK